VLVPLVRREPQLTVLLTLRTEHLPSHGGQVAFPGGKIDEADIGPLEAALREAHEETGLDPRLVEPLGYLDVYQTRTGFRIVPVVGLVDPVARFSPADGEVAEVFEVPLGFLMDPLNHLQESRLWQGWSGDSMPCPMASATSGGRPRACSRTFTIACMPAKAGHGPPTAQRPSLAGADWLADRQLQRVLAALAAEGGEARIAGGAVRNGLLGEPVNDIDIATTELPTRVEELARRAGSRSIRPASITAR
jgi:8-oxo-dGTP pyrophosphatase MutT (NUDIX family)